MVRFIFLVFFCISFVYSSTLGVARSFLSPSVYNINRNLINAIFSKEARFIDRQTGQVDTLKVLSGLKSNGLLNLSFNSSQEMVLTFDTKGNPLLILRIVNDTLEELGYNDYLINHISKHEDELSWSIRLKSTNIVDPVSFSEILNSLGCKVKNIQRSGEFYWTYKINAIDGQLKTIPISLHERKKLNKPNSAYWFKVYGANKAEFYTSAADHWFAKIQFYDRFLQPLSEEIYDKSQKIVHVKIPPKAFYMKVGDKYKLDNIRRGLTLRLR